MRSAEAHTLYTSSSRRDRPWLWRWLQGVIWGLVLAVAWVQPAEAGRSEVFRGERAVPAGISSVHARFVGALQSLSEAHRLRRSLAGLGSLQKGDGLAALNAAVNQVPYKSDFLLWGQGDYWAKPTEFFDRGGDCEDYAIAKYVALRNAGYAAQDLRLVVLYDRLRGQVHAGLTLRSGVELLFLDSVTDEIRPWPEVVGYQPIYSLNESGLWFHLESDAELERLLRGGQQPASR